MTDNSNQHQVSQEEAIRQSFKSSLEDCISILEGIGPLCRDIDELINMLELAIKNPSQLELIFTHLAPKKIRR